MANESKDNNPNSGYMNTIWGVGSSIASGALSKGTEAFGAASKLGADVMSQATDFMHYKHEWVKMDKSKTNSIKNNVKVKKPPIPKNLKCFFCKKKGVHWPKNCPKKKKKKGQDDTKETDEGMCPQIGILVIGNTGTGKSSIIKLLSGVDTIISHGAKRGTENTSIITSKYNENLHFIDSVGLQDSDREKFKDSDTLKNTLRYLHFAGIDLLKIIYCVAGDTSTREGLFAEIAKFIPELKVKAEQPKKQLSNPTDESCDEYKLDETYNPTDDIQENVWNSVLILKKGPKSGIESEEISEFSGIFSAAKTNGASNEFESKNHIFGFICYDWDSTVKENKFFKLATNKYEEYGYYSAKSAKTIIQRKLQGLPSFELKFRHEKCTKCGADGDSRYITAPCHSTEGYFHDKPLTSKHTGVEVWVHKGKLVDFDFVTEYKFHPGRKEAVHQPPFATKKYHAGPITKRHKKRVVASVFSFGISELYWKDKEWKLCEGCDQYVNNLKKDKTKGGCKKKYECCEEKEENDQCSKEANRKWSCCAQAWDSRGCKNIVGKGQMYNCCHNKKESKGCDMIYNCCKEAGEGCKLYYPCCNKEPQAKGCKRKCVNCRKYWGNGPGCVGAL